MIPFWKTSEGPHELALMFLLLPGGLSRYSCVTLIMFIIILSFEYSNTAWLMFVIDVDQPQCYGIDIRSSNMTCLTQYVTDDTFVSSFIYQVRESYYHNSHIIIYLFVDLLYVFFSWCWEITRNQVYWSRVRGTRINTPISISQFNSSPNINSESI